MPAPSTHAPLARPAGLLLTGGGARAAYQVVIDPESGMALRLGVQERYDSNAGTGQPNDFNYYAALGFNF